MKDLCTTFFAFQIGICVFKWDKEKKKYLASPFNFYIFPSAKFQQRILAFQLSTIYFLTTHKMNWDKVFTNGLHFWQRSKRSLLEEKIINFCENGEPPREKEFWYQLGSRSDEDKQEIIAHVTDFLDKPYKEKEVLKLKPNRNKVCWREATRAVQNLCYARSNVKCKSNKDKSLTITKFLPREDSKENSTECSNGKDFHENHEHSKGIN